MNLSGPKIDRDRANNVKCKILKNGSFDKGNHNFLTKTVIFQNLDFYFFFSPVF